MSSNVELTNKRMSFCVRLGACRLVPIAPVVLVIGPGAAFSVSIVRLSRKQHRAIAFCEKSSPSEGISMELCRVGRLGGMLAFRSSTAHSLAHINGPGACPALRACEWTTVPAAASRVVRALQSSALGRSPMMRARGWDLSLSHSTGGAVRWLSDAMVAHHMSILPRAGSHISAERLAAQTTAWGLRLNHENTFLSWGRNAIISTVAGVALVQYRKAEGRPPLAAFGLLCMVRSPRAAPPCAPAVHAPVSAHQCKCAAAARLGRRARLSHRVAHTC